MQDTILRTRQLLLRPLHDYDWEILFQIWQDPDVGRFFWSGKAPDEAQCRELTNSLCTLPPNSPHHFLILDAASQEPIGLIGLLPAESESVCEIDFTVARHCWSHGYATEATHALLEYARDDLGLQMVIAHVDEGNWASRRVLEKNGFVLLERTTVRSRPQWLFTKALRCEPESIAERLARVVEKLAA